MASPVASAYLGAMGLLRYFNLAASGRDFVSYVREDRPYKLGFAIAAVVPAVLLVTSFIMDGARKSKPPPPTVIYVESWPLDRSMDDVLRDQKIRQNAKDRALARRQEAYRALGRAMGMDMEKAEREATAIREKSQADAMKQPGT